jgi:hypothetical protein
MINWVDIVSPRLRAVHQAWIGLRSSHLMPDVRQYNQFAGSSLMEGLVRYSTMVVIPPDGSSPVFKHVGGALGSLLPTMQAGSKVADLGSPLIRHEAVTLFKRVCGARQPDTRRGVQRNGLEFEHIILPFGDGAFRVCVVCGVYDLAPASARSHVQ